MNEKWKYNVEEERFQNGDKVVQLQNQEQQLSALANPEEKKYDHLTRTP